MEKCTKCGKQIIVDNDPNGITVPITHRVCYECFVNMQENMATQDTNTSTTT